MVFQLCDDGSMIFWLRAAMSISEGWLQRTCSRCLQATDGGYFFKVRWLCIDGRSGSALRMDHVLHRGSTRRNGHDVRHESEKLIIINR
jgi:hypothetical protein